MNLAVRLYISEIIKPLGIPDVWPSQVIELGNGTNLPDGTWQLMTTVDFATYLALYQSVYDAWAAVYYAPIIPNAQFIVQIIRGIASNAIVFAGTTVLQRDPIIAAGILLTIAPTGELKIL